MLLGDGVVCVLTDTPTRRPLLSADNLAVDMVNCLIARL